MQEMYFWDFMSQLERQNDLHKQVDEGVCQYKIALPMGSRATVCFPEKNVRMEKPVVSSEQFAPPISNALHARYIDTLLQLNHEFMQQIPAALSGDLEDPRYFRLVWHVPRIKRSFTEWVGMLQTYDQMQMHARQRLQGESWTSFMH